MPDMAQMQQMLQGMGAGAGGGAGAGMPDIGALMQQMGGGAAGAPPREWSLRARQFSVHTVSGVCDCGCYRRHRCCHYWPRELPRSGCHIFPFTFASIVAFQTMHYVAIVRVLSGAQRVALAQGLVAMDSSRSSRGKGRGG